MAQVLKGLLRLAGFVALTALAFLVFFATTDSSAQGLTSPQRYLTPKKNDTISGADTVQPTIVRPDVSRESPRASLDRFFALTREGHYDSAVIYLDLPDSMEDRGPVLARQLKSVLDRHLWVALEDVSAEAIGDTTDGLPAGVDQLGHIATSSGNSVPVRLVRFSKGEDKIWRFSRGTVVSIPIWYHTLKDRWVLEHLPPYLLKSGPLDMLRWQWLAFPVMLFVSVVLGYAASKTLRRGIKKVVSRYENPLAATAIMRLGTPFTFACALIAISFILPSLALYEPAAIRFYTLLKAGFFIAFIWALWRVTDAIREILEASLWASKNPSSKALLPLAARTTKVLVFVIAFLTVFSVLGFPVGSIIAGLGIGGLALALAAQKTVENLFGAFSLGVDQPFREGDFVKVDNFLGSVETIGLRSTRFRTLDRTLISIPNGHVAEMKLESYTARDRIRFQTFVRLLYGTKPSQVRFVIDHIEKAILAHPLHWPEAILVKLSELGENSLTIEVRAWFLTTEWMEFIEIRQGLLLQIMEIVEESGARFAVPTRAIRMIGSDGGPYSDNQPDDGEPEVEEKGRGER